MPQNRLPKSLAKTCVAKHPEWAASQIAQPFLKSVQRGNLTLDQAAAKIQVVVDDLLEVVVALKKPDAKAPKRKK